MNPVPLDLPRWCGPYGGSSWLAPGVRGEIVNTPWGLIIWHLEAITEGNGDVGRWLDRLPPDKIIVVPLVLSSRLAGMLQRRGFELSSGEGIPDRTWTRMP